MFGFCGFKFDGDFLSRGEICSYFPSDTYNRIIFNTKVNIAPNSDFSKNPVLTVWEAVPARLQTLFPTLRSMVGWLVIFDLSRRRGYGRLCWTMAASSGGGGERTLRAVLSWLGPSPRQPTAEVSSYLNCTKGRRKPVRSDQSTAQHLPWVSHVVPLLRFCALGSGVDFVAQQRVGKIQVWSWDCLSAGAGPINLGWACGRYCIAENGLHIGNRSLHVCGCMMETKVRQCHLWCRDSVERLFIIDVNLRMAKVDLSNLMGNIEWPLGENFSMCFEQVAYLKSVSWWLGGSGLGRRAIRRDVPARVPPTVQRWRRTLDSTCDYVEPQGHCYWGLGR